MAQDVYQPCPCGSGKKLKFCCLDVADEMARALRLHETNQPRLAEQTIDKLRDEHPECPWVYVGHAGILLSEKRPAEAQPILAELFSRQPDHPYGLVLNATAALSADGYDRSKAALYRAFQKSARTSPELLSSLALGVASLMMSRRRFLACRQHLALAMRLAPDSAKEEIFSRLVEFDNNGQIPYPLRSTHQLLEYPGEDDVAKQARQAMVLASTGCFESAARLYLRLTEQVPESWILWQNAGFCRAWAGDDESAAEALRQATKHQSDFETAVELETVAQLLERGAGKNAVQVNCWEYRLKAASKVLTILQEHDRFVDLDLDFDPEAHSPAQALPAGMFEILDRPAAGADAGPDVLPRILGELTIFDAHPDDGQPARALLTGLEGEAFEQLRALCDEVIGAEVTESAQSDEASAFEPIPKDLLAIRLNWHLPDDMRPAQRRERMGQMWRQIVEDVWPNTKLGSLDDKTPAEAAGDAGLKVALLAAVYVLDAFAEQQDTSLDVNDVCGRLQIEPLEPLEVNSQTSLSACSAMQLIRLPLAELDDDQVSATFNRALLIRHSRFLYTVLLEVVKRPACAERVDLDRVYNTLADLCYHRFEKGEALDWLHKARENADAQENAFEMRLRCDLRELSFRLDDPETPEAQALLQRFSTYYLPKLPELRETLNEMLETFDVEPPWDAGPVTPGGSADTSAGGIWTPDAAAQQATGKSLWIPGQD